MGVQPCAPIVFEMDLRYLRYFIAVAEECNFSRAAERLNTVQPSLSHQIKRLEVEFVGTPLFQRDKHHVKLTEAGRVFLVQARVILSTVENAIALARQAARAEIGDLTIGFVPGAEGKVFPHILPMLRTRCPGINLTLRGLTTPEQIEALRNGAIVAVVPADHELARQERVAVTQLAKLPFVLVARSIAPAVHDAAKRIAESAGVTFELVLTTDNVLGTLNAVGSGLGFSLLPDFVRQISPRTVAVRSLAIEPPPRLDLVAAYRAGNDLPALAVLLDLLRAWIAQQKAGK